MENYLEVNRKSWDERVDFHAKSEFYSMKDFLQGESSLKSIELDLLGDITGKKVLHLQCHFGQDSISLSRLGAEVTGVDFSSKAISLARELAEKCGTTTQFVCSDVYTLPEVLKEEFDIVFTSYGTIGWLPDLQKWAGVISHFLKPNGVFVFAEFHPVIWMFDDNFEKIAYGYSDKEAIIETVRGTYADKNADIELKTISWNHGLSDVMTSLLEQGLILDSFKEYFYSPYPCFNKVEEIRKGEYVISALEEKIPYVYSIKAHKSHSN